jgi:pimeloyl-ACP methyl ester carboxylesterase
MIATSHADIAISETSGKGLPVLLIHGNSSCKEVFAGVMANAAAANAHMIAFDLPGHGASSDAFDPARTYTMPGYAAAAVELLDKMGIDRAAVYGWSLGGHIALEMLPLTASIVGMMISGAPPVGQGAEKVMAGFQPSPHAGLVGKADLTPEEAEILLYATYGAPVEAPLRAALARTDGRARALMFQALVSGQISDQRAVAERSAVPLAIVNGADDMLVNLEYIGGLPYKNLWDEHCYVLRGAAHAVFRQAPEPFNALFSRFVAEMNKRTTKGGKKSQVAAA